MCMAKLQVLLGVFLLLITGSCATNNPKTLQDRSLQDNSVAIGQEDDIIHSVQEIHDPYADFAASGYEPGWTLKIYGDILIDFKTTGPEDRSIKVPTSVVAELREGQNVEYVVETSEGLFEVRLRRGECKDPISGEAFNYVVIVKYGDLVYRGCGNYVGNLQMD